MKDIFTAWAIDTKSDEGHGFIGRYWWFDNKPPLVPKHLEGCKVTLFKTRKLARENLKSVTGDPGDGKYHAFPNATVRKVKITIESVGS